MSWTPSINVFIKTTLRNTRRPKLNLSHSRFISLTGVCLCVSVILVHFSMISSDSLSRIVNMSVVFRSSVWRNLLFYLSSLFSPALRSPPYGNSHSRNFPHHYTDFVEEPPKIFTRQKTQNFGDFSRQCAHKWQLHYQMQTVI